jgi:hypothetical protein
LRFEEFQDGFSMVNKGVLPKNNILVVAKDNSVMLDSKFNA